MAASPIADLSYRNYDGPLDPPLHRWWAIAKMSMKLSTKKKGFWVWASMSGYWYLILLVVFYFVDQSSQAATAVGQQNPFFKNIVWKDQFLNAFSVSQLFMFILALLLGAGTIANDNRANALLVYLSKPCSKLDYVIGKWLGVFIPMTIVAAVPTMVFYLYCLLSYRSYGFVTQDPWLIVKLIGVVLVPGFFHASASLGISSLFQQGRLAGATYAALYFFGLFFTKAMQSIVTVDNLGNMGGQGSGAPSIVSNLYYCSIDGIQIALTKIFLHTDGSPLISPPGANGAQRMGIVELPSGWVFIPAFFVICGLFMLLAWSRIRAVEVVG
jgi:ABC-2 type transport system permease protein